MNSYDTTYHDDGSVEYWSVYRQQWMYADDIRDIPDCELAAMDDAERARVMGHLS